MIFGNIKILKKKKKSKGQHQNQIKPNQKNLLAQSFDSLLLVAHLRFNLFKFSFKSCNTIFSQIDIRFKKIRVIFCTSQTRVRVDWITDR